MGQATNHLLLLSGVGVMNAAPRERPGPELPPFSSCSFLSIWELREAAGVGGESRITAIGCDDERDIKDIKVRGFVLMTCSPDDGSLGCSGGGRKS